MKPRARLKISMYFQIVSQLCFARTNPRTKARISEIKNSVPNVFSARNDKKKLTATRPSRYPQNRTFRSLRKILWDICLAIAIEFRRGDPQETQKTEFPTRCLPHLSQNKVPLCRNTHPSLFSNLGGLMNLD